MSRPDQPIALNLARVVHRLLTDPRGWRVDRLKADLDIADRTYRKYRGLLRDHLEPLMSPDGRWQIDEVTDGEARYLRLRGATEAAEAETGFLGRVAGFWLARKLFEFSGDSELRDAVEGGWAEFVAGIKDRPFYLGHLLRHTDRMLHFVADAPKDYRGHEAHLRTILRALFYCRQVEVLYTTPGDLEPRRYTLCPLTLVMWRGGLYVAAIFEDGGKVYLFAVERIRSIEVTRQRFRYPTEAEYHPAEHFAGAFGIFHRDDVPPARVEVRFAAKPWLHRYLQERTWHPSQVFTEAPDGHLVMTMTVSGFEEVLPWLRSFGEDAEALAPPELVQRLAKN